VFRLGLPVLAGLAHTVMFCLGGLICIIAFIGIEYLVDLPSAPSNKENHMTQNPLTPSNPTINRLLKSTLKVTGAIGTNIWAAVVLSV